MPTDTARGRPTADRFISRASNTVWVAAGAASAAAVMALPVLRAPSTRVFGAEIVGRHHDPFTVMRQFAQPLRLGVYSQPLTDAPGALVALVTGPIAAYNWLVLLTFPLAAATAFLLARRLDLSRTAAAFAAFAFAFSPFHTAQAAYHLHIAQVQWVPLYLLALWRSLDRWSPSAAAALVLAAAGVTLSNFYAGLIAAVVTPVAVAAYWLVRVRGTPDRWRSLIGTSATLALIAGGGLVYAWRVAPAALRDPAALAFDRAELFKYSATWWGYFVPPVVNPWLGDFARRIWASADIREGLLEQQVTLGAGVILLGVVALGGWRTRRRAAGALWAVPVLVVVALTALFCSLSPERVIDGIRVVRPSAWIYAVAPMFRSYARFGVVVQLMAALLAGLGLDVLRRGPRPGARLAAAALVALVAFEYAAAPAALWRDVLPTPAHRWLIQQSAGARALDCVPLDAESSSVPWLTGERIGVLGGPVGDCYEPRLPDKLAALGTTHMIVRRASATGRWFDAQLLPAGLRRVLTQGDADILEVLARRPAIYTGAMAGFFPREIDGVRTWRWMGGAAVWEIVNTTPHAIRTTLRLELQAFHTPQHLEVLLDGRSQQVLTVDPERRSYGTTPLVVAPGGHVLAFRALEPPTVADAAIHNGDPRALSVAFGAWTWNAEGGA